MKGFVNTILEKLSFIPDKTYLRIIYFLKLKKRISFKNPRSFNEKLQFLKLRQKNAFFSKLSDKYAVRDYVKEVIGKDVLTKILWIGESIEDIPFSKLPQRFVIKINCSSGQNILIKDKQEMDVVKVKKTLKKWLGQDYWKRSRELNYKGVRKKILIEEFLEDSKSFVPNDFKFFVFNGKTRFVQIDVDRFKKHKRCIYDTNWNKQSFGLEYDFYEGNVEKPKNLKKMITYAEKLAKNLPFARVDFYEVNNKVKFGEITFYPGGGLEKFFPNHDKLDKKFGDLMKIK